MRTVGSGFSVVTKGRCQSKACASGMKSMSRIKSPSCHSTNPTLILSSPQAFVRELSAACLLVPLRQDEPRDHARLCNGKFVTIFFHIAQSVQRRRTRVHLPIASSVCTDIQAYETW